MSSTSSLVHQLPPPLPYPSSPHLNPTLSHRTTMYPPLPASSSAPHLLDLHLCCSPSFTLKALSAPTLTQDDLKKLATDKAVEYVSSGMVLGHGTGSAAAFVVAQLGEILASGKLTNIVGVPTSKRTFKQVNSLNIPLATLDTQRPRLAFF